MREIRSGVACLVWAAALSVVFAACDGEEAPDAGPADSGESDGGPVDAGAPDAGPTDAGPTDGGPTDAGATCGGAECAVDEACVRDVCLATCGTDTSTWDAALAVDLTPVASFCRSAAAFGSHSTDSETTVFDVSSAAVGSGTQLDFASWAATVGETPSATPLASLTVVHEAGVSFFGGGYVEVAPSGAALLYGYTLSGDSFFGEVFRVLTEDGMSAPLTSPGNFDAAWLSDSTIVINGLGLGADEGQGIYAAVTDETPPRTLRVATNLGSYSGSVAVGPDFVLAGASLADFSNAVYVAPRSAFEEVVAGTRAEIDFEAEGARVCEACGLPSAFELVGGEIVIQARDGSFALVGLTAYPIEGYEASAGLTLGAPHDLTTGDTFDQAHEAAAGRTLLTFGGGLLLVE